MKILTLCLTTRTIRSKFMHFTLIFIILETLKRDSLLNVETKSAINFHRTIKGLGSINESAKIANLSEKVA